VKVDRRGGKGQQEREGRLRACCPEPTTTTTLRSGTFSKPGLSPCAHPQQSCSVSALTTSQSSRREGAQEGSHVLDM
jgi:hypothetical protein